MIHSLFYPYILHVNRELKSKRIQPTVFLKMMKFWNWSDLWNPILFLLDERCNEMSRLYKRSTKSRVSNRHDYSLFFLILVFMKISYLQLRHDVLCILNAKPTERAIVNAIKSLQNLYNNAELEHFDYSQHLCRYSARCWVQWGSEKVSPVLNSGEPLWDLFVSNINELPGLKFFMKQIFVLKFLIYVVYLYQMNVHVVFHNEVILVKSSLLWVDKVCIDISRFQLSKTALSVNNIELV